MTVRLIAGPPGAGKNHYVEQNAKPEDYILDFDELREYFPTLEAAKKVRDEIEASLKESHSGEGKNAWVIRGAADPTRRAEVAERCGASEVIVIETPADLAKERITQRDRYKDQPEKIDELNTAIDSWWSQYSMVESDLIVKPDMGNLSDREKQMPQPNENNDGDKGFPADTPVADMTDAQAAAYWKFHSRKHENQVKDLKGQLEGKNGKVAEGDGPEKPDADAIRAAADKDARDKYATKLVVAEFKSAIAGRMSEDDFKEVVEDLNLSNYLTAEGEVDTARVQTKALILAPVNRGGGTRRGTHQSRRTNDKPSSVEAGRDLYKETHGIK